MRTTRAIGRNIDALSISKDGTKAALAMKLFGINPYTQVFIHSINSPSYPLLISYPDGVVGANSSSSSPEISGNGRYVVFISQATNFVTGATSGQIYRKDLQNLALAPVIVSSKDSTAANQVGQRASASTSNFDVSADGRFVSFVSLSTNLVTGASIYMVYLKDMDSPASPPIMVSSLDSTQANQAAYRANNLCLYTSISPDGRHIAFATVATNLVTGANATLQVYIKDRLAPASPPVMLSSNDSLLSDQSSVRGNSTSGLPAFSPDSRYVAFTSSASNFVSGATGGQIYVKDMNALDNAPRIATSLEPTAIDQSNYKGNGTHTKPRFSFSGNYFLFESTSTNLVPGITGSQVYMVKFSDLGF